MTESELSLSTIEPPRPSKPTSLMVLALVMVVAGFMDIFSGMTLSEEYPRLGGLVVGRALFMMVAGLLLMGPKIGWYLAMIAAGLNLIGATIALFLTTGFSMDAPDVGMIFSTLVNAFLGVVALMILLNPKARASHGIGA